MERPVITLSFALMLLMVIPVRDSEVQAMRTEDEPVAAVHIGVLGLFHPRQFTVSVSSASALVLHASEEHIVLEKSSGLDSVSIRTSEGGILLAAGMHVVKTSAVTVTGRKNEPVDFVISIPQKITRRYHGTLEIKPSAGILIAVVTMDREAAVASVVAAESMPDTPTEALKAQATATRSYFAAGGHRHYDFDFCDTTHCQFLREPPEPTSAVGKAVTATHGFVLAYDSQPFSAMYTRSCNGSTRTPADLGLPSSAYPYYSVECKYCRAHPARWSSRIATQDAATLRNSNESARINTVRRLGWSAVPSNDFVAKNKNDQIVLEGTGMGHGIGLCQSGARAMAAEGATFVKILSHYYPNTTIITLR